MDLDTEAEGRRNRERKRSTGRRRKSGKSRGRERWVGERDSGRCSPNVPIPDSPVPGGPPLLKLNLGTCMLEKGSLGLGNPPFLVSLLPSPTPDPPSYIPSATPATAAVPTPGAHPLSSDCSLGPSTHLYCSPLSLSTVAHSPHRSLFPKAPPGA